MIALYKVEPPGGGRVGESAPPQHGVIEAKRPVGGGEDHDVGTGVGAEAVPELHELRLHAGDGLVLLLAADAQHRLDLVCTHSHLSSSEESRGTKP